MAMIQSGDWISVESANAKGSGTLGCIARYVDGNTSHLLAVTNFHVFAVPLGTKYVLGQD